MNCMGPVEQKRFQVRLSSDDVDSLNVNVSPSFTELLVSVGGVSVRSGHDSGWDPLSLSGRGFICICHVAASSRAII